MSYIPGLSPFAANRARPYLPSLDNSPLFGASPRHFFSLFPPFFPLPSPPPRSSAERNCHRAISSLESKISALEKYKNSSKNSRRVTTLFSLGEFRGIEPRFETLHRVLSLHFFQFFLSLPPSPSSRKTTQAISCFHACETRPRVRRAATVQQFSKPVRRMKIVDSRHSTGE